MRKYWLPVISVTVILSALLIGCGPSAATQGPISVSCDDFQKQPNMVRDVTLKIGSTLTVSLCSNKTTGFSWPEKAQIGDPQVIEQTAYKWNPPQDTGKVGAAGAEVYTFKALQPGTSVVSLGYSRPWEGGEKNVNTFKLNVTVK